MPDTIRRLPTLTARSCVLMTLLVIPAWGASPTLPSSADSYMRQAAAVRQSADRPWLPESGQLGNLRHLQITAKDCVVRIVSGSENRVLPGTSGVMVVERSRVLDANPNEQPPPRDVVLAPDGAQACPGPGVCGVSVTPLARASDDGAAGSVCFTVELATGHDLLLGGDRLAVLFDRVHQPALRISINPSYSLRIWLEQVNIGLLSIHTNAAARVGGNGTVDFLGGDSSSSGSFMFLQEFNTKNVGVSSTVTGTRWAIRIDADTRAQYYQPARAPGAIAKKYPIEIEGLIDRLEVPVGHVDPQPLSKGTRIETQVLRHDVLALAGPARKLPASETSLAPAAVVAASLPEDPNARVARVVARYLPASIRFTEVALWKQGGRLEGIAPDAATARDVARLLTQSGEFTYVSGGNGIPRDGGFAFSTQLNFTCEVPGQPSTCPAGETATSTIYSEAQVRDAINAVIGPLVLVTNVSLSGDTIELKAVAPTEKEGRAGLERLRQRDDFFRISTSTVGPSSGGSAVEIGATLKLRCIVPPKPDGICTPRTTPMFPASKASG